MEKDHNWVENEAKVEDNHINDHTACEECEDVYLFHMRDMHGEFALSLRAVLTCLALAEKEGAVPEIPGDWWIKVETYC